jgi:hypothetical protein
LSSRYPLSITFLPHPDPSQSHIISQSGILSTVTEFELVSTFAPAGSKPEAIRELTKGLEKGEQLQTLRV